MKKRHSAWIQMDVDSWELVTELLPDIWPEWAVFQDLRYWQNGERMEWLKRPSRRQLQARWGWSDWSTRQALKSEDKWGTSQSPPNSLPKTSQSPPKNSTQIPEIRKATNPTPSNDQPKTNPTPSPRANIKNKEQRTKNKEDNKTLMSVWSDINTVKGGRPLKLSKSRAKTLRARLEEHSAQELLQVIGWWQEAKHPRAQYLRENGHGIDTLLRASKFESYLEMSQGAAPKPAAKTKANWGGDFYHELMSDIEPQSDILTITTQPITIEEELEHVAQ